MKRGCEVRVCLDTNVLLRFALKDVPAEFTRAKAVLESPDVTCLVADVAWVELAYALQHHYGLERAAVVDVLESLMSIDSVRTVGSVVAAACALFLGHPQLSFTDCYLAAYAGQVARAPLYTFDQKLARQHATAQPVPG